MVNLLFPGKLEGEERKKSIEQEGKSWKQWAREDLARYWYVILCLFLDMSLNLQFTENYFRYGDKLDLILTIVTLISLIPIAYIEYRIYGILFHRTSRF